MPSEPDDLTVYRSCLRNNPQPAVLLFRQCLLNRRSAYRWWSRGLGASFALSPRRDSCRSRATVLLRQAASTVDDLDRVSEHQL